MNVKQTSKYPHIHVHGSLLGGSHTVACGICGWRTTVRYRSPRTGKDNALARAAKAWAAGVRHSKERHQATVQ